MRIYIGRIYSSEDFESYWSARLFIEDSSILIEIESPQISYFESNKNFKILNGTFNLLGKISLIDCSYIGETIGGGASIKKFQISYLLSGAHFKNLDQIKFNKVLIDFPSLFEWLNVQSINYDHENNLYRICDRDDIKLTEFNNLNFYFSFFVNQKFSKRREYNLKEISSLKIESKNYLNWIDFINLFNHFKKFIVFCTNLSSHHDSIHLYNNDLKFNFPGEEKSRLITLTLLTNNKKIDESIIRFSPKIEFDKVDIKAVMSKWLSNQDLKIIIDLILEKAYNNNLSRENYFLNCCFAFELLHRTVRNNQLFNAEEFKHFKNQISSADIDKKFKDLLNEKLGHFNEPNLKKRFEDYKNDLTKLLPKAFEIDDYLKRIVNTRNYLVHRSSSKKKFEGIEIYYAARYVEALVKIIIFRGLGVSEEYIDEIIEDTNRNLGQLYYFNTKDINS